MGPFLLLRRVLFTSLHQFVRGWRYLRGARGSGVHSVVLTPEGKVVLVRLTYAPGWRLPGGGRKRGEDPAAAALRELREEIGLLSYSSIEPVADPDRPGEEGARSGLFLVRGVRYRPKPNLEVEDVREFALDRLPPKVVPWSLVRILAVGGVSGASAGPSDA